MRLTPACLRHSTRAAAFSLLGAAGLICGHAAMAASAGEAFFAAAQTDRVQRASVFTLDARPAKSGLDSAAAPRNDAPAAPVFISADLASL